MKKQPKEATEWLEAVKEAKAAADIAERNEVTETIEREKNVMEKEKKTPKGAEDLVAELKALEARKMANEKELLEAKVKLAEAEAKLVANASTKEVAEKIITEEKMASKVMALKRILSANENENPIAFYDNTKSFSFKAVKGKTAKYVYHKEVQIFGLPEMNATIEIIACHTSKEEKEMADYMAVLTQIVPNITLEQGLALKRLFNPELPKDNAPVCPQYTVDKKKKPVKKNDNKTQAQVKQEIIQEKIKVEEPKKAEVKPFSNFELKVLYGDTMVKGLIPVATNNKCQNFVSAWMLRSTVAEVLTGKRLKENGELTVFSKEETEKINAGEKYIAEKYLKVAKKKTDDVVSGYYFNDSRKYVAYATVCKSFAKNGVKADFKKVIYQAVTGVSMSVDVRTGRQKLSDEENTRCKDVMDALVYYGVLSSSNGKWFYSNNNCAKLYNLCMAEINKAV